MKKEKTFLAFLLIVMEIFSMCFPFAKMQNIPVKQMSCQPVFLTVQVSEFPSLGGDIDNDTKTSINKAITSYKKIGNLAFTFALITMLLFLAIQFYKLGKAGDNATERKQAITRIFITGTAIAMLGSLKLILIFSSNLGK